MAQLDRSASEHLAAARSNPHGRSAELLVHDGVLRQTVIALRAGTELSEHNSPHAASIQVLEGALEVTGFDTSGPLRAGELAVLTHERHGVTALEDSVFLLTTVTGVPQDGPPERAR